MDSRIDANERTPESLAHLRIALQWRLRRLFRRIWQPAGLMGCKRSRYGGGANLAETDELIGASPRLQNVRDPIQHSVLAYDRRWHGESAEGNPSGGNKFRGCITS